MFRRDNFFEFGKKWVVAISKTNEWFLKNGRIIECLQPVQRTGTCELFNSVLDEAFRIPQELFCRAGVYGSDDMPP
jgi:hypothetical protein